MLKSSVGYSTKEDEVLAGKEVANMIREEIENPKLGLLYTSKDYNQETLITSIKDVIGNIPIIGCTSMDGMIVPDGIIGNGQKFCGLMVLEEETMKIGIASSNTFGNPRGIAHKLALEAMENAGMGCAPDYIYMIASTSYEEDYMRGIEDVVGRVPLFGGGIKKDTKNAIFTSTEVLQEGVAVAFIYTKKKIVTEYIGPYEETEHAGVITALDGKRTLLEIDGEPSLKKYAKWVNKDPEELLNNIHEVSVNHPLGVKDVYGENTAIRHILSGNQDYSMNISNDLALNTAVTCMQKVPEQLLEFGQKTLEKTKEQLKDASAYLLIQSGFHKYETKKEQNDLYLAMKKATQGVPFILVFTNGEYGYNNHSANMCGELMLSFTGFSKE